MSPFTEWSPFGFLFLTPPLCVVSSSNIRNTSPLHAAYIRIMSCTVVLWRHHHNSVDILCLFRLLTLSCWTIHWVPGSSRHHYSLTTQMDTVVCLNLYQVIATDLIHGGFCQFFLLYLDWWRQKTTKLYDGELVLYSYGYFHHSSSSSEVERSCRVSSGLCFLWSRPLGVLYRLFQLPKSLRSL